MDVIGQGAEAKIYRTEYLGRSAILKVRLSKGYRHPELDHRLRMSRMKNEIRVMRESRNVGVRTPVIYDIDVKECSMTMEHVHGRTVKAVLDDHPECADDVCMKIGRVLAKLHRSKIFHGDLTTSNMILMPDGELCLIDLSLGGTCAETEDMGVDIHLMERAFNSAHSGMAGSFDILMKTYMKNMPDSRSVIKRVEDIKNRGRYT